MHDEFVPVVGAAYEQVGDTVTRLADIFAERGLAEVEVDGGDALTLNGEAGGKVNGDERLAAAGVHGGHHDDLLVGAGAEHELHIGAYDTEGLVDNVSVVGLDQYFLFLLLFFVGLLEGLVKQLGPRHAAALAHLRQFPDKRHREALHVLAAADGGVQVLADDDDGRRDDEADEEGEQEHIAAHGRGGRIGAHRRGDDACVIGGECLRELVLLPLLQQIEVKLFLDLLLTLLGEQVFGLGRRGSYLRIGDILLVVVAAYLCVEGIDLILHRSGDGYPHSGEALVEVLHQRVARRTVKGQAVALEELLVVVGYLLLDGGVADARVGRQELIGILLVGDEAVYVAGYVELVAQIDQHGVGAAGLLHIYLRGSRHIGNEVVALVGGDGVVHAAQLLLDDIEALVNEVGSADGYLVLVLDPALIVDIDKGIEEVLGPLCGDVLIGEIDDGGLLVLEHSVETVAVVLHGGDHGAAVNLQLDRLAALVIALHQHAAERSGDKLVQVALVVGFSRRLAVVFAVAERHFAGGVHLELEAAVVGIAQPHDRHPHRQVLAVESLVVECAALEIVHIQMQAADSLEHYLGRLDGRKLIVDIRLGGEQSQVGEDVHVGGDAPAVVVVVLDEDRRRACIDGSRAQQVDDTQEKAARHGDGEPFPVGQAKPVDVLERHRALRLYYLVFLFFHNRSSVCIVRLTE